MTTPIALELSKRNHSVSAQDYADAAQHHLRVGNMPIAKKYHTLLTEMGQDLDAPYHRSLAEMYFIHKDWPNATKYYLRTNRGTKGTFDTYLNGAHAVLNSIDEGLSNLMSVYAANYFKGMMKERGSIEKFMERFKGESLRQELALIENVLKGHNPDPFSLSWISGVKLKDEANFQPE